MSSDNSKVEPTKDELIPLKEPFSNSGTMITESVNAGIGTTPQLVQPPEQDIEMKREFLWRTHDYLNEYIRFGDAKAGFVGAIATALMGALYAAKVHVPLMTANISKWPISGWIAAAAILGLMFSVFFSVLTIYPRLRSSQKKGFIYWGNIAAYERVDLLRVSYESQSAQSLDDYLLHHLFDLSRNVCTKKYRYVSLSIWSLCIGALLAGSALVLHDAPREATAPPSAAAASH